MHAAYYFENPFLKPNMYVKICSFNKKIEYKNVPYFNALYKHGYQKLQHLQINLKISIANVGDSYHEEIQCMNAGGLFACTK